MLLIFNQPQSSTASERSIKSQLRIPLSSKLNRQQMKSPRRAADTMFEAQQHLQTITVISSIATKASTK
jgi:hypothetical protein